MRSLGWLIALPVPSEPVGSLSSVDTSQMRERERLNAAVADVYVKPQVAKYLSRLVDRPCGVGIEARIFMMH